MMKEYKMALVSLNYITDMKALGKQQRENLERTLNKHAQEGWELKTMNNLDNGNALLIFEREKVEKKK
ncbi:MAG: DUF4177 domain-containing protein [Clostridia bacterium]|nr:DUF4177 domain-containing protein [Clostridia bacterium]